MSRRHGSFWSAEEDATLGAALARGETLRALAPVLGRTHEALKARRKLLLCSGDLASAEIGASPTPPAADPPAGSPHPAEATACPMDFITPAEVNPCEGRESGRVAGRVGAGHITDRYVLSLMARGVPQARAVEEARLYRQRRAA